MTKLVIKTSLGNPNHRQLTVSFSSWAWSGSSKGVTRSEGDALLAVTTTTAGAVAGVAACVN